jgi:asparagine synthase (glutamine-hydrolysing)
MCGIAGFLTSEGKQPERELLRKMCDTIAHRGPDGFGFWLDDQVALGHRRLSIIDLSTGAQPLGNEDNSIQVTFNGEIYNYLELRQDLISRGHVFRTGSDTECLVHLYEEVGERLVEQLNGMFAFAIWDTRKQELLLARDRMGKKPIYYQAREGVQPNGLRFAFASELKALRVVPGFDSKINTESVADYLSLGYVPDPQSIYAGVSKLPAGHTLTVTATGQRLRQYWEPTFTSETGRSEVDTAEEICALASDATRRRMISDVPLGAFLSGGVDSSAVVGWMASTGATVKSFSIGFTSKEFDELEYARIVAEKYHTEHHERVVTPKIEEMFGPFVDSFDEPFADSSAIPTLYLSRMTREKVTVALSGDGADEVFAGYRLYSVAMLENRIRGQLPQWFRTSVVGTAGSLYPKFDFLPRPLRAKTLLTNVSLELAEAHFNSRAYFGRSAF